MEDIEKIANLTNEMKDDISNKAYMILERIWPSLKRYESSFMMRDRMLTQGEFYNVCFELAIDGILHYRKNYTPSRSSKSSRDAAKWKQKNGLNNHKMKLETYVYGYIKDKLKSYGTDRMLVRVSKGDFQEIMPFKQFSKKQQYYKAAKFNVDFITPEVPLSYLSNDEEDEIDFDDLRDGFLDPYNFKDDDIE